MSLAREGKEVTLVEESGDVGWPAYIYPGGARHEPLARYLNQEKVKILVNHKLKGVSGNAVKVEGPQGEQTITADTILVALGREPEDGLYQAINERGKEIHLFGDAKEVRSMPPASHEGFWVGRQI